MDDEDDVLHEIDSDGDIILVLEPASDTFHEPYHPAADGAGIESSRALSIRTKESQGTRTPNTVRFRVSSKHLTSSSRYFKRMLEGPWRESVALKAKGRAEIMLEEQESDMFLILLNIIHGHTNKVPLSLDFESLCQMATLVDFYDCLNVIYFIAHSWIPKLRLPVGHSNDMILWIWISWVFKHKDTFKAMTAIIQHYSKGPIDTFDLPIPDRIPRNDPSLDLPFRSRTD